MKSRAAQAIAKMTSVATNPTHDQGDSSALAVDGVDGVEYESDEVGEDAVGCFSY